jgi:5'-deoxynucleotidase YfbR-like HD superfamily hydrolase
MRKVMRYNSRALISPEDVSQHSWYISYICLTIHCWMVNEGNCPKIDLGVLLTRALVHDMDEMLVGDVPRPLKYWSEETRKAIDQASIAIFNEYAQKYLDKFIIESVEKCKDGPEGEIVALADLMCVIGYCAEEVQMGNSTMRVIFEELSDHFRVLENKITIKFLKQLCAQCYVHVCSLRGIT